MIAIRLLVSVFIKESILTYYCKLFFGYLISKVFYSDGLICGIGMLFSVPFFYGFILLGLEQLYWIYILAFIGLWFINLNWALVGDILLV